MGVNWYWNRNAKLVFNYEQANFDGGTVSGDRETENAFLSRLQLAFEGGFNEDKTKYRSASSAFFICNDFTSSRHHVVKCFL